MCTEAKEAELKDWAIGLVNILYTGSWYGLVVMLVSALLALACGMFRFNDWPYGVAASVCVAVFALLILGGLAAITVASGVSQSQMHAMLDSVSSGCCQGALCRGIACEGLHDPVPQQLLPWRDLRWSTSCLEVEALWHCNKVPSRLRHHSISCMPFWLPTITLACREAWTSTTQPKSAAARR